jgi:hypothetical protein
VLRFDKDIYLGSYSSKYDWQGNRVASYAAVRTNIVKVAPGEFWGWAGGAARRPRRALTAPLFQG